MVPSSMTITPMRNLKFAFVGPYFVSGKSILTKQAIIESVWEPSKINNPDKVLVALKGSTSQIFAEKLFPKAIGGSGTARGSASCARRGGVADAEGDGPQKMLRPMPELHPKGKRA